MSDVFGNLLEWDRVLSQLDDLLARRSLDEHQDGLVRLLRYPDNWRLRERALGCVKDLGAPSEPLVREMLAIVRNENVYWEARALAIDALCTVVGRRTLADGDLAREIIDATKAILARTQPPQFRAAIKESLAAVGAPEDRTVS